MPLNAIQQFTAVTLGGLTSPQYPPLNAIVTSDLAAHTEFIQADMGGTLRPVPFAFVWGATGHEDRQTMPRGPGWKKIIWRVTVILQVIEDPDDPYRSTAFPLLVDQVRAFLGNPGTVIMPQVISDPVTGAQSQVLNIGEEIDYEIYIPDNVSPGGQAALRAAARLTLKVDEAVQGVGIGLPA